MERGGHGGGAEEPRRGSSDEGGEVPGVSEEYLAEAERLAREGDTRQAGEKLWGAATALVKLYAALKGVPVVHWSRGRLDRFVDNNVEEPLREKFQQLLDTAERLHEHFYEDNLSPKGLMDRYNGAKRLIEELRKRVYRGTASTTLSYPPASPVVGRLSGDDEAARVLLSEVGRILRARPVVAGLKLHHLFMAVGCRHSGALKMLNRVEDELAENSATLMPSTWYYMRARPTRP